MGVYPENRGKGSRVMGQEKKTKTAVIPACPESAGTTTDVPILDALRLPE